MALLWYHGVIIHHLSRTLLRKIIAFCDTSCGVKSHVPYDTGGSATQIVTCFLQVQNSSREDPGRNTFRMRHIPPFLKKKINTRIFFTKLKQSNTCKLFLFWVIPRRLSSNCRRFGTHYRFHLHRQVNEYSIHLPMKMEPIVSSETSAIRTQMPGNYPKRNNLHLEHGKSLRTRI